MLCILEDLVLVSEHFLYLLFHVLHLGAQNFHLILVTHHALELVDELLKLFFLVVVDAVLPELAFFKVRVRDVSLRIQL